MQDFRSNTPGRAGARPRTRIASRIATQSVHLAVFVAFAVIAFTAVPAAARDEHHDDESLRAERVSWQNRYRDLLTESDQLRDVINQQQELYADANRRNYRRGSKRHFHRTAMEEAKRELAEIEAKLAAIEDEARLAGAQPGWLRQVEIELEDEDQRPAVTTGPGDEGRNPLYLEKAEEDD